MLMKWLFRWEIPFFSVEKKEKMRGWGAKTIFGKRLTQRDYAENKIIVLLVRVCSRKSLIQNKLTEARDMIIDEEKRKCLW